MLKLNCGIMALLLLLVAGVGAESKYVAKASHLGSYSIAVSCTNGADPTVAGKVGDALIVSCGK